MGGRGLLLTIVTASRTALGIVGAIVHQNEEPVKQATTAVESSLHGFDCMMT